MPTFSSFRVALEAFEGSVASIVAMVLLRTNFERDEGD